MIKIKFKKRKTPNDFTRLGDSVEAFKKEVYKALYIPQIVEWLAKKIK